MGLGGQPLDEANFVGASQRKSAIGLETVEIVGFHRVEALGLAAVEAGLEDQAQDVDAADVEPALAPPAATGSRGERPNNGPTGGAVTASFMPRG